ncbi:hydrogenase maturation protein [Chromobacterium sp. IIBBL 290-4]|uniref:hydrogenase maturation protein n=1 Tax=Chromobacterium sp. IIBBL 290-4 TaxID=2953890 RepID=UPI0020B70321|nr:hydrogenase maturation protein [Chromobacterium sp. IIBBL 290-4]UTH76422.1 hydrogenase maturation protein [Chromobacterium sp. IIBBL 290-4]
MRIVLLSTAFNGLTQRAWLELRASGHQPSVVLFTHEEEVTRAVLAARPELVICPFLKDRVPPALWRDGGFPVVIIHPGIVGDRGASALDWAILKQEKRWGVTALQAVEEMDAGPVWSSREFDLPAGLRKSELYNGLVSDAAIYCIRDVAEKHGGGYLPQAVDYADPAVRGRLQPNMRQQDRAFDWRDPAADILRKIAASDGQPGVLADLAGGRYYLYDAHLDARRGEPGAILATHDDAALVGAGDASLWIGSLRRPPQADEETFKLPARLVLGKRFEDAPVLEWSAETHPHCDEAYQPIRYRQIGKVGELTFEFYNGAFSTEQSRRLQRALQWAKQQETETLVLRSGRGSFCNGIHLNVIEAADDPAAEAWRNIQAIDDVCLEILTARQMTVAGVAGNAGAGGVMLALCADVALARQGVVLNPHYQTMGLYGSEYWTYVLPRAVGAAEAARLCGECLPVGAREAWRLGMLQDIGPRDPAQFGVWLLQAAKSARATWPDRWQRKLELDALQLRRCREAELAEMRQDMLENRRQFAEKRRGFVFKRRACATMQRLIAPWAKQAG